MNRIVLIFACIHRLTKNSAYAYAIPVLLFPIHTIIHHFHGDPFPCFTEKEYFS
jgi:hypothetical protein